MEYKGLWGNDYDSGREDYESSLLVMKRKAGKNGMTTWTLSMMKPRSGKKIEK